MSKIISLTAALMLICLCNLEVFSQQPPPPGAPPKISIEERLKNVKVDIFDKLSLSSDQQQKMNTTFKDFFSSMEAWHQAHPQQRPEGTDIEKIIQGRDAKVKSILNATQFTKYKDLEQKMREKMKNKMPPPPKAGNTN